MESVADDGEDVSAHSVVESVVDLVEAVEIDDVACRGVDHVTRCP